MGTKPAKMLNFESVGSPNGSNGELTRRFGVFELDLRAGELRRNGRKVKLQEQPFQVLVQLLERPGEVVTREDLRNHLWPADTFVDFDHSLNAAIRRLRDALGDSAENPTFVETVSRRGYRFLSPVSTPPINGIGPLEVAASIPAPEPASARLHRGWIVATAISILLTIVGLFFVYFLAYREAAPARFTQLTANPVNDPVNTAAVSHDGRYLAFSDDAGFYLRQIVSGETHPVHLPQDLTVSSISWFPDSVHMIVEMTGPQQKSSLWEVSALGGTPRMLVDDGRVPEISPEGKEIAFITGSVMHQRISLAAIDGTQVRELLGDDGDMFGRVVWSPDGTRIAYTTARLGHGQGVRAQINVVEVHGSKAAMVILRPTTVLSMFGLEGPLVWTSDGRLIFSQSEPRPRQLDCNLWALRLNSQTKPDGPPVRLTNDAGVVFSVNATADSKRIVYVKGVPQPDVYVVRLNLNNFVGEPQRLTLDDREDLPFDWTPDGKQVIFISDRTGTFNIYKQSLDQSVPEVIVAGDQQSMQPRLSPDGTQLIYVRYPNTGDDNDEVPLLRVPLGGGAPQQIAKAKWIVNHQCAHAPATLCLYSVLGQTDLTFFSYDPMHGAGPQIYQVKDEMPQLYNWSLSPDATTLALVKGKFGDEDVRLHLVSLNGAPDRWLPIKGWPDLATIDWAADSKSLWAATVGDRDNALLNIDLQGNVRPVWRPKKVTVEWAIPSRDGKSLALHVGSTSANAWMLDRP